MASNPARTIKMLLLSLLVLLGISQSAADKGKSKKIIIHVPYKIHNHHHTHTNYKLVPVSGGKTGKKLENLEKPRDKEEIETEAKDMLTGSFKSAESKTKPKKLRASMNIQEATTLPLLNYLGLNDLFGDKSVRHLHLLQEPLGLLHSHTPASGSHLFQTYPDQDYQFSDGTFFVRPPLVKPGTITGAEFMVNENEHPEHNQVLHQVLPAPFYENSYNYRYGKKYFTHKPIRGPHQSSFVGEQSPYLNNLEGEAQSSTPESEYEHIGYLVVGDNNQNKFLGMKHKDYSAYSS